jgi:O-antigen ligase
VTGALFLLALAPASLLALALSPSATILNQLAALCGWGVVVASGLASRPLAPARAARLPLDAIGLMVLLGATGVLQPSAPFSLTASTVATLLAAAAVLWCGSAQAQQPRRVADGFFATLVFVGLLNFVIAVIQVFAPDLADGSIIVRTSLVGRAVGNLRQPNHLSTLVLWCAVAVVPLVEGRRLPWEVGALLLALFTFTIELSGSRTGMIGVLVLGAWGVLDRRLSKPVRWMLLASPVIYALGAFGMTEWAHHAHQSIGVETRLHDSGDISSSRFPVWKETLALIAANPWTGVGFGEYNFAWTLSAFPGRPPEFFDHCHNAVLQLLVEFGIPAGGLIVLLLAIGLWQAFRRAFAVEGERGAQFRAAFVMVLLVVIHSQLEYPLWYAYFLLPAAWAWGFALGTPGSATEEPVEAGAPLRSRAGFVLAGVLMVVGAAWGLQQYIGISRIFEPDDDSRPLQVRIEDGERSAFYAYHAAYADVTVAEHPSQAWSGFRLAPHYLLDTRLMMAWATAFAERGDLDHARYLAQRMREFRKPEASEFFSPCVRVREPGEAEPFQCGKPSRDVDWREFRDPRLWSARR